jgi:hypothetical protein
MHSSNCNLRCRIANGSSFKLESHLKDKVKPMNNALTNGIAVLINKKQ